MSHIMNSNKLSVSETFISIQGEGMTSGRRSVFLRLAGCNLMCGGQGTQFDKELHDNATWRCDTIEVWMKGKMISFESVFNDDEKIALIEGAHLIVTGGEPLLQQDRVADFIDYLSTEFDIDPFVEIETNGTIMPTAELIDRVSQWNVSPKLANSGNSKQRLNFDVLSFFNDIENLLRVQFKFVISDENDLNEIESLDLDSKKIVLMPSGSTRTEIESKASFVANEAIKRNYNYSHRLQVAIWNQTTGV